MEKIPNAPRSLLFSTRLYRALLTIYPAEFRRAYGTPMLQTFRDCCRQALRENGNLGLFVLWVRTMLDTLQSAIEEHSQRGVDMSKPKFVKLSGWALILGSLAMAVSFLASTRPEYNPYSTSSLPIDQLAKTTEHPLMILAMLFLTLGLTGLLLQYGQRAASFGRASLALGWLSGLVGIVGAIGLSIEDSNPWWSMFFFGLVFELLGLALFGLANLSQPSMPRGNGLPLLAGLWIPLYTLVSLILERNNGAWVELPLLVDLILFLLTAIGLAALGYLLQSDSPAANTTAAAA